MIIRGTEREEIQRLIYDIPDQIENSIGRDSNDSSNFYTHVGNGWWIGSGHRLCPKKIETVKEDGNLRRIHEFNVIDLMIPEKMSVQVLNASGQPFTLSKKPDILLIKTDSIPGSTIDICPPDYRMNMVGNVVGWKRQRDRSLRMVTMPFSAKEPIGFDYEFCPIEHHANAEISEDYGNQNIARLEAGESGGPSFVDVYFQDDEGDSVTHERRLYGIHSGPGGRKGDGTWIGGVDVWLGQPQVNEWIWSIIGALSKPEVEANPQPRIITVKPGEEIIIKGVEK